MSELPVKRFRGPVRAGDGRGRTIGFPTANVAVDERLIDDLPRGVHVGVARLGETECGAVVNIGRRPTFGPAHVTVEVHLLDFTGDIYGEELDVELGAKLRDERRFASPDELVEQIHADVARARAILTEADRPAEGGP